MKKIYISCILYPLVSYALAQGPDTSGTHFKNGVVVSAHPQASEAGIRILKQGGNAIDAAVAVQFALAVVYPNAGNIGGGGFLVFRAADGHAASLDFREKAPLLATKDMYLDSLGTPITDKSLFGHFAAGVPGTVDGMVQAHAKFGRLSWKKVIQPAIDLATQGFPVTSRQADELNKLQARLAEFNPGGTDLIKASGTWKAGDLLVQPGLARTLTLIRDKGRKGFYEGSVAKYLVAEMKRGRGLISEQDLRAYHSQWRKPVTSNYKDYTIITMPPPSSGGIALIQLLQTVEQFPVKRWGHNQDSTVQLITEAERRVYADRATHLGDPDFYRVPQPELLRRDYQKQRISNFRWDRAASSSEIKAGVISRGESEETTHFSITDKEGNAVAVTTTLNGSYGSLVVVQGAGFLLNNEMDDFSVKPGTPNMYGLVGGEANAIAPGKRMLSSMTPTIIERNGKLFMVVGTPGGSTIITSVFQTILNVIEFGMPVQQAVSAPRFHHQWLPDEIYLEDGALSDRTEQILLGKGYKLSKRGSIGRVDAIVCTSSGYQAGADPRGDDTSSGY